jgi:hypothetical protein
MMRGFNPVVSKITRASQPLPIIHAIHIIGNISPEFPKTPFFGIDGLEAE